MKGQTQHAVAEPQEILGHSAPSRFSPRLLLAAAPGLVCLVSAAAFGWLTLVGSDQSSRPLKSQKDLEAGVSAIETLASEAIAVAMIANVDVESVDANAGQQEASALRQASRECLRVHHELHVELRKPLAAPLSALSREVIDLLEARARFLKARDENDVAAQSAAAETLAARQTAIAETVVDMRATIRELQARAWVDADSESQRGTRNLIALAAVAAIAAIGSIVVAYQSIWTARRRDEAIQLSADAARSSAEEANKALLDLQALRAATEDHALVSVADRGGRIVDVNRGFCRISGYSRDELLDADHRILNSGHHPREFWADMWRTIGAGRTWRGEVCNRAKDGSLYWVDSTIVPQLGPDGRPQRYVSIRFDITSRKQVEGEVAAFRAATEDHALVSVADRGGRIVDVNRGFCRISGYSRDELLDADHRILNSGHHPREFWVKMWRTIGAGRTWRGEVCNRAKDGSLYWVDSTIVPQLGPDGRPQRYVSIRFDITSRKNAEEKAEISAAQLDAQLDAIDRSHGRIDFSIDGTILDANDNCLAIVGYEREELIGQHHSVFVKQQESDSPEYKAFWRALAEGNYQSGEFTRLAKDGTERWINAAYNPVFLPDGRVDKIVKYASDVTAAKNLERQVAHSQKMESIGQLAAGIAHEINTPMQYIEANVSFLSSAAPQLLEIVDRLTEEAAHLDERAIADTGIGSLLGLLEQRSLEHLRHETPRALDECAAGVDRVRQIVRAMKEFSHPGTEEKTEVSINDLAKNAALISRNQWKYIAELELDLEDDLPPLVCRPTEISQVLLNLIVNAADSIAEGRDSDESALGQIELRTRWQKEHIVIECQDSGPGIPSGVIDRVFDPFFTTKEVGKGTGQGLTIAHDIVVNRHGGELNALSDPGKGATFQIRLPATTGRTLEQQEPAAEVASGAV